jgi:hypothetical protein
VSSSLALRLFAILTSLSPVDKLVADVKKLPVYSQAGVDLIDRAVSLLTTGSGDSKSVLAAMAKVSQTELGHAVWSEADRKKLADGMARHGNDIEEISDMITSKKIKDVVKRYYIFLGCHGLPRLIWPLSSGAFSDLCGPPVTQTLNARGRASTDRGEGRCCLSRREEGIGKSESESRVVQQRRRRLRLRRADNAGRSTESILRHLRRQVDAQMVSVSRELIRRGR